MLDPRILLFDVNGVYEVIQILFFSTLGIIAITSGTQGYFVVKSKIYESFLLVAIGYIIDIPDADIIVIENAENFGLVFFCSHDDNS